MTEWHTLHSATQAEEWLKNPVKVKHIFTQLMLLWNRLNPPWAFLHSVEVSFAAPNQGNVWWDLRVVKLFCIKQNKFAISRAVICTLECILPVMFFPAESTVISQMAPQCSPKLTKVYKLRRKLIQALLLQWTSRVQWRLHYQIGEVTLCSQNATIDKAMWHKRKTWIHCGSAEKPVTCVNIYVSINEFKPQKPIPEGGGWERRERKPPRHNIFRPEKFPNLKRLPRLLFL